MLRYSLLARHAVVAPNGSPHRPTLRHTLLALSVVAASGCTSLRSTIINRYEDDTYAGNSNGELKRHDMARPYRGVPITIKVPTHVDVKIIETSYMYNVDGLLRELKLSTPHREVDIKTIETDKVFIVDFKRPLSGSLNYKATFGDDQYFDEVSGKLEDTTITDVANLVATVAPMLGKPAAGSEDSPLGDELIVNKRVVAYRRFDIDAYDFEMQVRCFLEEHLNCGHTCAGPMERAVKLDSISPLPLSIPYPEPSAGGDSAPAAGNPAAATPPEDSEAPTGGAHGILVPGQE